MLRWQDLGGQSKNVREDLEAKALKAQYTMQEKYSQSVEKKDEIITKTADSLVEGVKKVKDSLINKNK